MFIVYYIFSKYLRVLKLRAHIRVCEYSSARQKRFLLPIQLGGRSNMLTKAIIGLVHYNFRLLIVCILLR